MGKSNTELLKIAQSHLGQGGSRFRKFAGLPAGAAWCNAFVDYVANEGGDASLFFNGKRMTYCPTSMSWCRKNLAEVPLYLALPCDIIYFDWEPNGVPNHIGLVRERKSDQEIYTIEGNTSGGIVAQKTRVAKYVCGVFRPHFRPTAFDANKKLTVDGYFGYNSIAVMQRWLGVSVDGILGQKTVKALQKVAGVKQDGHWGPATSKAVQKMTGAKADGFFGRESARALQIWCNKKLDAMTKTLGDKIADSAKSYVGKVKYVLGGHSLKTGIDCTGFIQAIYGLHGINLDNRLSDWGKSIGTDLSKAQPGDIITFKHKNGKVGHHAIYIGNGKCVHAANPKSGVILSKVSAVGLPIEGIRRRWK